jgi:hypothetical protein
VRRAALALVILTAAVAAEARPRAHAGAGANMPPGWTWPPSAAMRDTGRACLDHLGELGVAYTRGPATPKVATPVLVPSMRFDGLEVSAIGKSGPFVMDCLLAESLAESAELFRSAGVVALRFGEIHDYRNINGGRRRILSRHALGLAIDVFAFITEDGAEHRVEREYPSTLLVTLEGWLLDRHSFRILTPGSDPRHHRDHFHLEVRDVVGRGRTVAALPVVPSSL